MMSEGEKRASETVGDGQTPDADPAPRITHFQFQARVFQAPGAHFRLVTKGNGKTKEAMFGVDMGAGQAMISIKHLRDNFGIAPGGHDDQLIERAEAGLKYVPDIRPGDAIPNELLDGTASWTVARKHKRIARERIQAQLLAWLTGERVDTADSAALAKIMELPETKTKLRDAFQKAAVQLGFKAEESERVVDLIETLARELCYIEALRERCEQVNHIRRMLDRLVKAYTNDQRAVDEIGRCRKLMGEGLREIYTPLARIDAKTADIVGALQTIDEAIAAIRSARDEIHYILMNWDPVIAKWQNLAPAKGRPADKALSALYHLLAGRFATGKSIMTGRLG